MEIWLINFFSVHHSWFVDYFGAHPPWRFDELISSVCTILYLLILVHTLMEIWWINFFSVHHSWFVDYFGAHPPWRFDEWISSVSTILDLLIILVHTLHGDLMNEFLQCVPFLICWLFWCTSSMEISWINFFSVHHSWFVDYFGAHPPWRFDELISSVCTILDLLIILVHTLHGDLMN